jgi:hypothetical protein
MSLRSVILLAAFAIPLGGCDSTVTKPQLYSEARRLRTVTPQGQMIHVGSDSKYDYYRFEPGGQRYKVPRPATLPAGPSSQVSTACGGPNRLATLI